MTWGETACYITTTSNKNSTCETENFVTCFWVSVCLYLVPVKSDCGGLYRPLHNPVIDLWAGGMFLPPARGWGSLSVCAFMCVCEYIHDALKHRGTSEQEAARLKSDLFLYCEFVYVSHRECERKLTLIHICVLHRVFCACWRAVSAETVCSW